jgi:hypothetical protein
MHSNASIRIAALLWLAPIFTAGQAKADFLFPSYNHSRCVKNTTGTTANDLHIALIHRETSGAPTAPPFTHGVVAAGGLELHFDGGSVPPGGTATVNWQSKFASDQIDATNSYWTFNGTNIGTVHTLTASSARRSTSR